VRPELLVERASDVLAIEERMLELDGLMVAASAVPRGTRAMRPAPSCNEAVNGLPLRASQGSASSRASL